MGVDRVFQPLILALAAAIAFVLFCRCGPGPDSAEEVRGRIISECMASRDWCLCAAACEARSPDDHGQGCVDLECNPLLPGEP
jgi:hypothetical protein